jgi:hypothetical protein
VCFGIPSCADKQYSKQIYLRPFNVRWRKEHRMNKHFWLLAMAFILSVSTSLFAEFRSARDMQKECRVALDVLNQRADRSFENTLFTGECIGYLQAAADVSLVMAENVSWFKVCLPDQVSTQLLIQKFIAFVDKYPQYTLASTAIQMMLNDEFPCPNQKKQKSPPR